MTASVVPPQGGWRTFLVLWASQSVSVIGSALTYFVVNIYLARTLYPAPEQKPQLALALALVSLAFALPAVFGAPIAGAWADRHDRRRIMLACDLGSALTSLTLAVCAALGVLSLPLLIVLLALGSVFGAFHGSAFDTSYAVLVPPERLPRANGLMQTLWSVAGLIAPGLAASLIALPALAAKGDLSVPAWLESGTSLVFLLDATTFLIAGTVLTRLFIPTPPRDRAAQGKLLSDVAFGFRYIWARRPLLWLLGTFAVANFAITPLGVLEPLIVKFTLAADWEARGLTFASALALLATVIGLGGVLGGVFVSAWGGLKRRRVLGVLIPLGLEGLAMIGFGLSHNLYLSAALGALGAATGPFANVHSQTIWQTQVEPALQGRVFSVRRLIAQFTGPVATVLAGIAGGFFDPARVILWLGAALAIFLALQLFNPALRRVEDKAWLEAGAARRSGLGAE